MHKLILLVSLLFTVTLAAQRPLFVGVSGGLGKTYGSGGHGNTGSWLKVFPGPRVSADLNMEWMLFDPYAVRAEVGIWTGLADLRYFSPDGHMPFPRSVYAFAGKNLGLRVVRYLPIGNRGRFFLAPNLGFAMHFGGSGWTQATTFQWETQNPDDALAYRETLRYKSPNALLLTGFDIVKQTPRGNRFKIGADVRIGLTPFVKGDYSVWQGADAFDVRPQPWNPSPPGTPPAFDQMDFLFRGTSISINLSYQFRLGSL